MVENKANGVVETIVLGDDVYGPGSWIDDSSTPVPEDARRIFEILARETPGFTQDHGIWQSISFEGSPQPIAPGPLKSPAVAAALHAMAAVVANELVEIRDGQNSTHRVHIDTDHASFWLGSVGMTKRNGQSVADMAKAGKLADIFDIDLENGTFGTWLRTRATANYPTKDPNTWYQLHGSLNADPVLRTIGIDPDQAFSDRDEAYEVIKSQMKKFSAHELEMIHLKKGLCGSICYTPKEWQETRMSKDLAKHPLVNVKRIKHAAPTPPVWMSSYPADKRPLAGIKVLEIVRVIAGPVIGNTLAAMGADVIRVNSSKLPDFNSLQLTLNAGVRTVDADLSNPEDNAYLKQLVEDADVFVQGYRSGVIAKHGFGLHDLLELAGRRGKGIVYVEENCYGPDGPMHERPGWQQIADAASGCSYVTGRSLGHTDGTCVLPALPVPDMLTGLIGAIGTMMGVRDRAREGGSYHVFASLMAADLLQLRPDVGLFSPEVVKKCDKEFEWGMSQPGQFVFELLDIVLEGWKKVFPKYFAADSQWMTTLNGNWGEFQLLKPVIRFDDGEVSPRWSSAPEPNCYHGSGTVGWLR